MAKVTEITVWTRGVVMDKEARDVANAFAQAAKMEGKFVQAFDNYEDLPDRVLVTTRKYARLAGADGVRTDSHRYAKGKDVRSAERA